MRVVISANPSTHKLRSNLLEGCLGDLATMENRLVVFCGGCPAAAGGGMEDLVARRPHLSAMTLAALLPRLRCQWCGSAPGAVTAADRWGGRRVPLVGPDAGGSGRPGPWRRGVGLGDAPPRARVRRR